MLVGPLQSAFIPGMLLVDSTVVASEIIASWKRKGTRGFMGKVDFVKAYDSLDWNFVGVHEKRGFIEAWIKWVWRCGNTHTFFILVNRCPESGWIHPQRGMRQGCPLALLLFVLAVDTLVICSIQAWS